MPPLKKGVTYAMIKPRPLRIAQVMMIRLSQALDSSTVLPEREKFISNSAMLAVTMAAMVELSLIHISEPTRQAEISYAVFCLKKKNKTKRKAENAYTKFC